MKRSGEKKGMGRGRRKCMSGDSRWVARPASGLPPLFSSLLSTSLPSPLSPWLLVTGAAGPLPEQPARGGHQEHHAHLPGPQPAERAIPAKGERREGPGGLAERGGEAGLRHKGRREISRQPHPARNPSLSFPLSYINPLSSDPLTLTRIQVLPVLFSVMAETDGVLRDEIFTQLTKLVAVVKQHMRRFLPDLLQLIHVYWETATQPKCLKLLAELSISLRDDFRSYVPELLPKVKGGGGARGVCLVRYTSGDQSNRSMGVAL
jgi:hypothetical protein